MANAPENNSAATQPPPPPMAAPIVPLNYPISTKLNQTNYLTWKSQIQPIIHGFNLTRFLDKPPPSKTIPNDAGVMIDNPDFHPWDMQDQLLLGWIRSSLTETIQVQVSSCSTTGELWASLKQTYSATSRARLTDLRRQIQSTTKGSSPCFEYLQTMRRLADELAFIGHPYSDDDLVMAILNGLGPEYDSFVISVTTASRHAPFTFADLHAHLLSHESWIQGQVSNTNGSLPSPTNPTAFAVGSKPNYQHQSNTPYQNRTNSQYQPRSTNSYQNRTNNQHNPKPTNAPGFQLNPPKPHFNQQQRPKHGAKPNYQTNSKPQCQICSKFGHVAKECYWRYEADPSYQGRQQSNFHAYVANPSSSTDTSTNWVLDSGATNHVTNDLNNLSSFFNYEGKDTLQIGNGPPHQDYTSSSSMY